jgi:hypothetical protein
MLQKMIQWGNNLSELHSYLYSKYNFKGFTFPVRYRGMKIQFG